MQAGDLRNRIDIYEPAMSQNELGEDIIDTLELVAEDVPAQIVPINGSNRDVLGDLDLTQYTHKIRIRSEYADKVSHDCVIKYDHPVLGELRYDVKYYEPYYKNQRFIEIFTVLEVSV